MCHRTLWCCQASAVLVLLLLLSIQRQGQQQESSPLQVVAARMGCDGRGGMVWHGACIGGISYGNIVVEGFDYSAGWHCGICFSEVVLSVHSFSPVQGSVMARDGSVRAAWSGSRVVAGTRPRTVVDKAEGVVAMAGCASNMVDMTEEAEAEVAEDETGMEMGDEEVAAGMDVMVGVGDVETGEESMGVDNTETVASQTEKVVWDGSVLGGTCMVTTETAGNETTEAVTGDIEEVVAADDTTEGMGVASHHGYMEFLRLDLRVQSGEHEGMTSRGDEKSWRGKEEAWEVGGVQVM
ncbi:hypothetical protein F5148DRAFT_1145715 [Russula earlei]|uniref:Uncharacterized protein n=1 Tax=Russula earlei TaxID=71964 RepID=A0ACC0UNB3_9AGAM|nr:hypothetical protein F5148DRAFT_1145715 [Russula earlei]